MHSMATSFSNKIIDLMVSSLNQRLWGTIVLDKTEICFCMMWVPSWRCILHRSGFSESGCQLGCSKQFSKCTCMGLLVRYGLVAIANINSHKILNNTIHCLIGSDKITSAHLVCMIVSLCMEGWPQRANSLPAAQAGRLQE